MYIYTHILIHIIITTITITTIVIMYRYIQQITLQGEGLESKRHDQRRIQLPSEYVYLLAYTDKRAGKWTHKQTYRLYMFMYMFIINIYVYI